MPHPGVPTTGVQTQPGSASGNHAASSAPSLVFPLKAGSYVTESNWSLDAGVDISTIGAACGVTKAPLLAIADGTVVSHGIGGFGKDAPTLKLDKPIQGYSYVYYGHSGPGGAVPIGTHVTAGQIIGSIGCGIVGVSTGPHLEIGFASGPASPAGPSSASQMKSTLQAAVSGQPVPGSGTAGSTTSSGGSAAGSNITGQGSAEAFTAAVAFPSMLDMATAVWLGQAHKGLMHDQQLLPFIQELTQASMRSFQSLPNGDFFAFFPDYFGEFNHHPPYWNIDDIEILTGDIYLNDSSLVTHQYVVGDNTYPLDAGPLVNELFSSGVITVANAFSGDLNTNADLNAGNPNSIIGQAAKNHPKWGISGTETAKHLGTFQTPAGGMGDIMSLGEAGEFINRYGARPQVSTYPQVRSSLYEMFLAYQQFMLSWSTQFRTTFSFTFMPEVFPGAKIAFPTHGIQMYVESVTHTWDYEEGFTTESVLTAPARIAGSTNPDIPPDMVQALVKPVRAAATAASVTNRADAISAGLSEWGERPNWG